MQSQKPMQAIINVGAKRDPNQNSMELALFDTAGQPIILGSGAGDPVASHSLDVNDLLLPVGSNLAPVSIGNLDMPDGLYQVMLYAEFDAPDQGDGSPPAIMLHLDGVDLYLQGRTLPWLIFQGNLGPTRLLDSDRVYVPAGQVDLSLHIEDSTDTSASTAPVTLDKFRITFLG